VRTHIPLPTLGIQPRLVECASEERAVPRSRVAAFLDALEQADLATYGPDPWGPNAEVIEVIGPARVVARIAGSVGSQLDAVARTRLAREGWFVLDPRTARAVHVRVISLTGAEVIASLVAAFRRGELRCASPRWRYEATKRRAGFRTVFSFVDPPSVTWLVMLVENVARRLDVDVEHSRGRARVDARVGDIDLTFELPS